MFKNQDYISFNFQDSNLQNSLIMNMNNMNMNPSYSPFKDLENLMLDCPSLNHKENNYIMILDDDDIESEKLINKEDQNFIVIDSTEDEMPLKYSKKLINKEKTIKTSKKIFKKIKTKEINVKIHKKNRFLSKSTSCDKSEILESINISPLFPLAFPPVKSDKKMRVGKIFQTNLETFKFKNSERKKHINDILNNQIWKPNIINDATFNNCKDALMNILGINYFPDEIVCELLRKNEFSVENTVKYTLDNEIGLKNKIINSFISNDPLFRKTRNSMYNKFLIKKNY